MLTANWKHEVVPLDDVPLADVPLAERQQRWINERLVQLREKIKELEEDQKRATGWGAAVGARDEWLKELKREIIRLEEGGGPSRYHGGLSPRKPWPKQ